MRKTYIDVPEIETFEWPPFNQPNKTNKDNQFYGILAGTSIGEILLISLEQKLSSFGGNFQTASKGGPSGKNSYIPYRIEKKLVDRNIKVSRRRCNALAWNPTAHNLVAAGYERSSTKTEQSCLFIWDLNMAVSKKQTNEQFTLLNDQVVGQLMSNTNPEAILDPKYSFKGVNDDVNSVCWLPGSETDLLAATEEHLKLCDTR